jgi:tetratricopeptide (TPR) repeat protein
MLARITASPDTKHLQRPVTTPHGLHGFVRKSLQTEVPWEDIMILCLTQMNRRCLGLVVAVGLLPLLPSMAWADDTFERGRDAYYKKDYDLAIACFSEVIRLNSKDDAAYGCRGCAYDEKGEYAKAIADHSEAIRLNPRSATHHHNRGHAYHHKAQYERAVADYTEAIRLNHERLSDSYYDRGLSYKKLGKHDKAIADYSEAIRLNPKNPKSYNSRARAYEDRKEYSKAISDYNEAILLNPDHENPYNGIAWIWATCPEDKLRNGKKAVEYATKACELTNWKKAWNIDTLAAAYAEIGEFDTALKWQRKALELPGSSKEHVEEYRQRLKLYEKSKPYRDEK